MSGDHDADAVDASASPAPRHAIPMCRVGYRRIAAAARRIGRLGSLALAGFPSPADPAMQLVQRLERRSGRDRCVGHADAPLAFSARSSSQRFCFGERCTTSKRPARSSRLSRNSSDRAVNRRLARSASTRLTSSWSRCSCPCRLPGSVGRARRRWRCGCWRRGNQSCEIMPVEAGALEHPLDRRHRADPFAVVVRRQQRHQFAELFTNRRRQRDGSAWRRSWLRPSVNGMSSSISSARVFLPGGRPRFAGPGFGCRRWLCRCSAAERWRLSNA